MFRWFFHSIYLPKKNTERLHIRNPIFLSLQFPSSFYLSNIHYQTHFILVGSPPADILVQSILFRGGQLPRTLWLGLDPNRFGNICQEKNSIFFPSQIINVRKGDGTNDNLNTYRKSYKSFLRDEFSLLFF